MKKLKQYTLSKLYNPDYMIFYIKLENYMYNTLYNIIFLLQENKINCIEYSWKICVNKLPFSFLMRSSVNVYDGN